MVRVKEDFYGYSIVITIDGKDVLVYDESCRGRKCLKTRQNWEGNLICETRDTIGCPAGKRYYD